MTRPIKNALIDAALRDLDPGGSSDLSAADRERAGVLFARIVSTPSNEAAPRNAGKAPRRRKRLLVSAGVAGAAGITIPALLLGGGSAYGSWTPKPEPLADDAAAAAGATCRASLSVPDRDERVAVAERRGGWTYVLLAGAGTEAICLMPNDYVGKSHSAGGGSFGSYSTDASAPPSLAPDRIIENTNAGGSTEEGWFNWLEGYVGSAVTAVTVHTSSGLDIQTSVVGNRFAAWWPGVVQSSDHPEGDTWSYTVHLDDGSTRRTTCDQSTEPC